MLLGLVHPTGGSVELLGHTLNESNRIALLRQTGSLIVRLRRLKIENELKKRYKK